MCNFGLEIIPVSRGTTCLEYPTIHDTLSYPLFKYIPRLIYHNTGTVKWRSLPVDTSAILSAYFEKHFYKDTLLNDTNALIIVSDTISQNKIIYRLPDLRIYPHIIRQTTYIKSNETLKRKFFLGIGTGRSFNRFQAAVLTGLVCLPICSISPKKTTPIHFPTMY